MSRVLPAGELGPGDFHQAKLIRSLLRAQGGDPRQMPRLQGRARQNQGEGRLPRRQCLTLACPHPRIARATEALQTYRPAASSSFRHCQLDVGREMKLLTELNFLRGKEVARPHAPLEPSCLLPQQRARGAVPTGDLPSLLFGLASHPSHLPTRPHHPMRSAPLLPLFVCRLWPSRTLLRSTPGKSAALPPGPAPRQASCPVPPCCCHAA